MSWAAGYINAIRDAGITGGCGNGNYCPQGLVTREQMAAFLVRAVEGEPAYSTPRWTVIPRQAGHLFQGKLDT